MIISERIFYVMEQKNITQLYKHMKFRDIDEAILDGVKEKLLEGFRKEEEFGYMAGYEPWEKLIFDR